MNSQRSMGENCEEQEQYVVDEALESVGFGKFQLYVIGYAGLGYAAASMETMIISFIGQSVKTEWNLSSTQESLITSLFCGGILVGAYLSGFISDNYGRRKGLLSVAVFVSGGSFLSAFAQNYVSLVIFRCLVGVGVGGSSVYLSWFLEFIPTRSRGVWVVIFATFSTLGSLIEASLAWIIMPTLGWRWLLALSSTPALATLVLHNLIVESPTYLTTKGHIADAHKILERAAIVNQTKLRSGILISDETFDSFDEDQNTSTEDHPLLLSPNTMTKNSVSSSGLRMLFSKSLYKSTLLLWTVFFGINFFYYGIILLTAQLTIGKTDQCSSSSDIHSHSSMTTSDDLSYRDILVTSFAELPGIAISALIIMRLGHKVSLEIMFIMAFLFMLPLVYFQNEVSTIISLFGARIFISGALTLAIAYAPEIYETNVRAMGVGLANSVGGLGSMVCPFVAVGLLNACYRTTSILLFELVIVVSGLCVLLFRLDTKGRELSHITIV